MIDIPSFNVDTNTAPFAVRCVDNVPQTKRGPDGLTRVAKRMSASYRTVDPLTLSRQLESAGFTVEKAQSLFSHRTGTARRWARWTYGIEARYPGANSGDEYTDRVRILCNHAGRESLKLGFGALRGACANQFTGTVYSVRHTDPEIDVFLADPAAFLFNLRAHCGDTVRNVEALRGRQIPLGYQPAFDTFPRIHAKVQQELPNYPDEVSNPYPGKSTLFSLWSLAQALTATRNTRAIQGAYLIARDHVSSDSPSAAFLELFSKN